MRWASVQAVDVKFSQDLTNQKSLKSVNFDKVIQKIKDGHFWGHECKYTGYKEASHDDHVHMYV